ncbi:MAG: MFS transporter [Chloroflexi bacterium]|nr:MFS transporter [Chloroflexota bacterium]MDA1270719.1 MFS transporter [Chloroflexota bacterium]
MSSTDLDHAGGTSLTRSPNYKYWVFGALAIGTFASVVDHGSVNVALPTIATRFQTDLPTIQWVVITYALTISALLLPMGRLSDLIGRRKVYIAGMAVLAIGAALAGLSPNLEMLFPARVLQGVGAAMTQGTGMAIITSAFPPNEKGRAIGLIMTMVGVGAVAGPAIGGLAVDAFGWRAVFFLTIPLEVIGVAVTLWVMRGWADVRESGRARFDWLGATLSAGILVALLITMTTGNKTGWFSPVILAAFAGSAAMLATFIWWELHTTAPMLDLRLFKGVTFSLGVSAAFLTFLGSSAVLFLMPFYLQNVLGYSAKTAGFVVVPGALCMAVLGSVSGVLSDRFGWRPFTVGGLASSATGLIILSRVTETSPLWMVVPALMLMNSGMGTFYSPNSSSVMNSVSPDKYGVVSGFLNLVRNAANVTSIAVATIIVTATMGSLGFEPSLEAVRGGSEGVGHAFTVGLRYAFLVMMGMVLSAMTISALQRGRSGEEAADPAADALGRSQADD